MIIAIEETAEYEVVGRLGREELQPQSIPQSPRYEEPSVFGRLLENGFSFQTREPWIMVHPDASPVPQKPSSPLSSPPAEPEAPPPTLIVQNGYVLLVHSAWSIFGRAGLIISGVDPWHGANNASTLTVMNPRPTAALAPRRKRLDQERDHASSCTPLQLSRLVVLQLRPPNPTLFHWLNQRTRELLVLPSMTEDYTVLLAVHS